MLIELLSQSNYISVNIKLAKIFGVEGAIYISEILNIYDKAVRKNKVEDKFFTLDREYFEERTTFDLKKQLEIENKLIKTQVLKRDNKEVNKLFINAETLTRLFSETDKEVISALIKESKETVKKTDKKLNAIYSAVCENIFTDNAELKSAYKGWILALLENGKPVSGPGVIATQKRIDTYTNRDLDVALEILDIATRRCYIDIGWAINLYEKEKEKSGNKAFQTKCAITTSSNKPVARKKLSEKEF